MAGRCRRLSTLSLTSPGQAMRMNTSASRSSHCSNAHSPSEVYRMYRIVHGSTHNLADVEGFIETLNGLDETSPAKFFDRDRELFVTRAPGRLDVMGGIADYSGSLMLELPIAEATLVAVQRSKDRFWRI